MAAALDGCRNYEAAEKAMPDFHGMRAMVMRHPAVWLLLLSLTPHLVASVINIIYNYSRIISQLDDVQQAVFVRIIYCYDPIGYAVGITLRPAHPLAGSAGVAVGQRASARTTGSKSTKPAASPLPGRSGPG